MVPATKEILFSRTKYTRFKGNKSRYMWKRISCLFNVWSIIDIFMIQPPPHVVWFIHFYLNFNYHGISRPCTNTLFLLQSKFSSIRIIFIHWHLCSSRTICDFVKFKDISRTWKINLLFSRMGGNSVYNVLTHHINRILTISMILLWKAKH